MGYIRRCCGSPLKALVFALVLAGGTSMAQDYDTMSIADIVASADRAMQRMDYQAAIPALQEVISRTGDLTGTQERQIAQTCRFELARIHYQIGNVSSGMSLIEEYLGNEPRPQERLALRMLAQAFFDVQDWDKIIEVAQRLKGFDDLDRDDLFNLNLLLGQALYQKQEWTQCVEPLRYAEKNAQDDKTQGICQIMVARALVESGQWSQLYGWIRRVQRTDRKYDIALNLTLMKAGRNRFENEEYLNALMLYRMVLPRETLLEHAGKRIAAIGKQIAGQIPGTEKATLRKEFEEIQESIQSLKDLPAYEEEVTFRIGQIYADVKRYWEAFVLFDKLSSSNGSSELGEAAALQSVMILYEVGEPDRAERRVFAYLAERPTGRYARTLLSLMMRNRLIRKDFLGVIELRTNVESFPETDDLIEQRMQADLHNMLAFGYLQAGEYKLAGIQFGIVLEKCQRDAGEPGGSDNELFGVDPDKSLVASALYYRGMSYMFQEDYTNALADFTAYQENHEGQNLYPDSMFREGVCLFGLQKIPESESIFTRFVDTFPSNSLVSEAYSLLGDIEASKEASVDDPLTLDRAQSAYRKAIDTATEPLQASYPAFQAAKIYKLEYKWQEIIDLMDYYMRRWGDHADISEAVFWVGQAQIKLEQLHEEAIPAYIEAIERFGNDPKQQGVDKIIQGLVDISSQHLSAEEQESLAIKIRVKLTSVDEREQALRLRLQVLQAMLEGEEAVKAFAEKLLDTVEDLAVVSPTSLALMCDAAVTRGDVEQMQRLADFFIGNFEDSELLWKGYRARIAALQVEKDHWGVLAAVDDVQGLFGVQSFMGWAQIMKADTLYEMGKFEDASEAYNMILNVPSWRGPLSAEATYGMGRCHLARNNYAMAHTFFQRTYLLFKAYDNGDWACKGYLAAAECLVKLGRKDDAVNTLKDMLENEYTNTNPLADTARERIKNLGGL